MADIPVYLIAGFLDGGKTDFINGILEDGFAREDKTLLICCEEGELEYEQKALDNVTVVTVADRASDETANHNQDLHDPLCCFSQQAFRKDPCRC